MSKTPTPRKAGDRLPIKNQKPRSATMPSGESAAETAESAIRLRFLKFHEANPKVYDELVKLGRLIKGRGFRNYSMKTLFEVCRWHRDLKTHSEQFRLNNSFTAYYGRLIMEQEEDLKDFFETRKLRV